MQKKEINQSNKKENLIYMNGSIMDTPVFLETIENECFQYAHENYYLLPPKMFINTLLCYTLVEVIYKFEKPKPGYEWFSFPRTPLLIKLSASEVQLLKNHFRNNLYLFMQDYDLLKRKHESLIN